MTCVVGIKKENEVDAATAHERIDLILLQDDITKQTIGDLRRKDNIRILARVSSRFLKEEFS
jgi:hypothetical protein